MMIKSIKKCQLSGTISIPSSKSDGQRAVLAAGFAKGTSSILNLGRSDDELAMLANIKRLGAKVHLSDEDKIEITGFEKFPQEAELDIGESGLGLRLFMAICACHQGKYTIVGHGSILGRSQQFFIDQLELRGVNVVSNNGFLPIVINGQLEGDNIKVDGSWSSQYISGLLMGLPLLQKSSILEVRDLKSGPYVEMTLNTLKNYGIDIDCENLEEFKIEGKQHYTSAEYLVEADWSSAGYWLVAAALGHKLKLSGLNMKSFQADRAILDVLALANCEVIVQNETIQIEGSKRRAFSYDATNCPDLFPPLVTLAAFCDGVSTIKGVSRLTNKESDRGKVLQQEFAKLGVNIELLGDEMKIHGGTTLHGGKVDSHHDHRIAMCLAIAGTMIKEGVEIENSGAVSKSYPDFWDDLNQLITH